MAEQGYSIAAAAADLQAAGLLEAVFKGGDRGLAVHPVEGILSRDGAFSGAGLDSRTLREGRLFVALPGGRSDGRRFVGPVLAAGHWVLAGCEAGFDLRPGLPGLPAPAGTGVLLCRDGARALAELARRRRERWNGAVIGITGTNGKTTTKDLCAAMLTGAGGVLATSGNLNNRLGVPLTLLELGAGNRFAVVEMGASAEGEIAFLAQLARPQVGVITNASWAHLAEFGSLEAIIRGKGELLDALPPQGTAVLNADSQGFIEWTARARCAVCSWGRTSGEHRWSWRLGPGGAPEVVIDGTAWPVPLPGQHNGANLTAAVLAVGALGVPESELRAGLQAFTGSPHRGVVLTWRGRTILDDSYNANPRSMLAAAQALDQLPGTGLRIAVLGPMAELGPRTEEIHRATGAELAAGPVDILVAVGEAARPLAEGFDAGGKPHHYCATCAEAAAWIAASTARGDRLLIKGSRSAAMETILSLLPDGADRE